MDAPFPELDAIMERVWVAAASPVHAALDVRGRARAADGRR
jgi:hypothetical protein